jgi:S1-C subfamily serine protease
VLGYNVLARYRIGYDLTSDRLTWTPLDFDPGEPEGENGLARTGVEQLSGIIKLLGSKLGPKTAPPPLRGGLGLELVSGDGPATVATVLADGPAATAGLKSGDVMTHFDDLAVSNGAALQRRAMTAVPGRALTLTVRRAGETLTLTVTPGKGF